MTENTPLPPYLPYPRFLFGEDLAQTTKLLYALLLDRATLSQKNGWIDENGRLYLVFPVIKIADAMDRSPMTVKNGLNELEAVGLIERQRQGFSKPNRIYVKLPDESEGQEIVQLMDRKLSVSGKEDCPTDGQKTLLMMDRKLSPNNLSMNNLSNNDLNRARGKPTCFGRYENVSLSEKELSELQTELPGSWEQYIERLSEYMASTGKKYSSHAATIRRWAAEDRKKAASKGGLPEYTCKEGESL